MAPKIFGYRAIMAGSEELEIQPLHLKMPDTEFQILWIGKMPCRQAGNNGRMEEREKTQISNSKSQTNSKTQMPMALEIGIWCLIEICILGFKLA